MGSINDIFGVFSDSAQAFIDAGLNAIESFWKLGTGSL